MKLHKKNLKIKQMDKTYIASIVIQDSIPAILDKCKS